MFTELAPVLKDRAITITVALEGDLIRINVIPQKLSGDDDDKPHKTNGKAEPEILTEPFTATGTAAELDAELPGLLTSFVKVRGNVATAITDFQATADKSLETVKAETSKATKAAESKLKDAKGKLDAANKKAGVKPAPETPNMFASDAETPDEDEDAGDKS